MVEQFSPDDATLALVGGDAEQVRVEEHGDVGRAAELLAELHLEVRADALRIGRA